MVKGDSEGRGRGDGEGDGDWRGDGDWEGCVVRRGGGEWKCREGVVRGVEGNRKRCGRKWGVEGKVT